VTFAAIDFETADPGRDSACALGLVRVEGDRIVARAYRLIRPPRPSFSFTWLHGIAWEHVANEPEFGRVWPPMARFLEDVEFLAAHNASFDASVLRSCCAEAGIEPPHVPFRCTVRIARRALGIRPAKLDHVCERLGIRLRHHNALSDAEACARIVLAAERSGEQGTS